MAELARLQADFANELLDPTAAPLDLFRGDPHRVTRCFALYRGNLTANWDRGLGLAYPVLKQLVGDEFFRAMARDFGRSKAESSGDLNLFGQGLADFLMTFSPLSDYPYMPDMARLEWLLLRAHYASNSTALDPMSLTENDVGAIESLQLRLRPSHYLFDSAWDVVGIWLAHQPGAQVHPKDIDRPSRCVVCRPNWRTELLSVNQGEYVALQLIDTGATLGEALESAYEADPTLDPATAFPSWLEAGLFAQHKPTDQNGEI